jgi:hypothetical protein
MLLGIISRSWNSTRLDSTSVRHGCPTGAVVSHDKYPSSVTDTNSQNVVANKYNNLPLTSTPAINFEETFLPDRYRQSP